MSIRRTLALTKQGIRYIQEDHCSLAVYSFRHALDYFQLSLKAKLHIASPYRKHEGLMRIDKDRAFIERVTLPTLTSTQNACQVSPHNVFQVYDRAFTFPQELLMAPHPYDVLAEYEMEISAILLYNQALAYLLTGLSTGSVLRQESTRHLQASLDHFRLLLNLLRQYSGYLAFEGWEELMLGLLTNLGFLLYHFYQTDHALRCSAIMDKLLPSVSDVLDDEVLEFFASTVSLSTAFAINAAPSA